MCMVILIKDKTIDQSRMADSQEVKDKYNLQEVAVLAHCKNILEKPSIE